MLRPPDPEREGGGARRRRGRPRRGRDGLRRRLRGLGDGGIEAPDGGADAGVEGGVAAHDSGAAGTAGRGRAWRRGRRCAAEADRRGRRSRALSLLLERDRLARRRGHLARGGIAIGGILGRRPGDDLVEGGHEVGARRAGLRRRVADVRPQLGDVAVLGVGDLAGQHLVQHATERVDVRATVDRVALDLLGGDVVGRPHPEAGPGQPSGRPRTLGQPEVGQVRVRLRGLVGDQDVRRLDVAVDQSARVRGVERVAIWVRMTPSSRTGAGCDRSCGAGSSRARSASRGRARPAPRRRDGPARCSGARGTPPGAPRS